MVDMKKLTKKLTDVGWDQKKADGKVAQLVKKAKELAPGEKDETIQSAVGMAIDRLLATAAAEKYVGVCLAVSDKTDRNAFAKRNALKAYEQNPVVAVQEKMVEVKDGKVIPLDNRKYVDAAQTMENREYGKPLREILQREGVFLVGGEITRVFGNYDAVIGMEYEIYGKKSPKSGIISIRKPGVKLSGEGPASTFKDAYYSVEKSPMAVSLDGVKEAKGAIVTTGFIRFEKETSNGHMVVMDDDSVPDGVVCFSGSEAARDAMAKLAVGTEILAFGRPSNTVNKETGEPRFSLILTGVVSNPESAKCAGIADGMDDLLYDE